MRVTVPTNHNFYEECPLTEEALKKAFDITTKNVPKNLIKAFSTSLSLTTKSSTLGQIQLFGFHPKRNKLEEDEQLILKLYSTEDEEGDNKYFIQTGLFAGVIFHDGYQINITSKYGDIFLRRMLNYVNDVYIDNQTSDVVKSNDANEFQNIIAYLFVQSLEKASLLGLPRLYQSNSQHSHKVRGKVDINAYLRKSIPFSGKITSTFREQVYVQEIIDVLYFACIVLEKNFGKEIHRKVLGTLQLLKQNYSGKFPSNETMIKAKTNSSLQNPAFSPFKRVIEYAEIIIKEQSATPSSDKSNTKTHGYLFDISQLFEIYLEKLLCRELKDWHVTSQEELSVYKHQFYGRKMFPDLVLKHKETNKIVVFDAKFKMMKFQKQDVDRDDFYQIHSYIQYYLPNAVLGGLIYPLSIDNNASNNFAKSLFGSNNSHTGFIIDGVYVNETMLEKEIIENEKAFVFRLGKAIAALTTLNAS